MAMPNIQGTIPVMLTPFTEDGGVDWPGLETLVEWYLANGSDALLAVCQSSEMQFLTLEERIGIARFVTDRVAGRVPVIASGHVSDSLDEQAKELSALASTAIDALVLVTNRLDPANEGLAVFRHNLRQLLNRLPANLPLGLYECPAPYRRLLTDDEISLCRDTGRFAVLKDVSCDLATVRRRVQLATGTPLSIVNANAAIAFDAMRAGSPGFAGVFTNFHPDLYAWLYRNRDLDDPLVAELARFLALSASLELMGYPALAKLYHKRAGRISTTVCRAFEDDILQRFWAVEAVLAHFECATNVFRSRVAEWHRKRDSFDGCAVKTGQQLP
jgi:4-hydroxy-tetrahydrodipicolinate synthase